MVAGDDKGFNSWDEGGSSGGGSDYHRPAVTELVVVRGDGVIHDYQTNNNNVVVYENMTDGGYIVPNPTQGYDMNPVDVYNANPQGHGVNPVERYNGNPILADEDMENPLDFAIPSPNGFGGVDNDILDTLGLGSQGFEGGFF
ncbi:hypothetical protein V6N11_044831 [Hibiscus sabdariffa]|uniref:Uncharacterized protein n=1 Tax=Hibiscus sabdariffa TaxID=183260 RepID=A0ABR2PUA9_9ROSI